MNVNKNEMNKQNYIIDVLSFFPFLLLLVTGGIMLSYHAGTPYESEILNLTGNNWLTIHKILSVISVFLISIHLYLHWSWIKKLFTNKLRNKYKKSNTALLLLFLLTYLTAILSWLLFPETEIANGLRGAHSKLGLILIIIFAFHLKNYLNWLVSMTKSIFLTK